MFKKPLHRLLQELEAAHAAHHIYYYAHKEGATVCFYSYTKTETRKKLLKYIKNNFESIEDVVLSDNEERLFVIYDTKKS